MRISERVIEMLIKRAMRTPYLHLDGYMERYWLIPYNKWGPAVRLHKILSSDKDRHMHNHPWPFISVILRGGYWEWRPTSASGPGMRITQARWHGPGSVLFRKPGDYHRLELFDRPDGTEEPVWTLFITGKIVDKPKDGSSRWGFLVDGVHVPADVYLGDRYVNTNYTGEKT